jgi:hypothetical protein
VTYTLQQHGFSNIPCVLTVGETEALREETSRLASRHRGGIRNLLSLSSLISALARMDKIKRIADEALQGEAFPVRALLFDKITEANWKVPWHQDTAIAVRERLELPGYTGWSVKDGVTHVHPPAVILAGMVSLRIHLDDCDEENGPLRIIPSTHTVSVLSTEQIESLRRQQTEVICCAQAGDILAMHPLVLHASSPAKSPSHRRVIHIEYACQPLPHGLHWHEWQDTAAVLN